MADTRWVRPAYTRGIDPAARFWSWVEKLPGEDACWEWRGALSAGYGTFFIGRDAIKAHRWSYESVNGPIADGLFACHHCDNRACVRPDHVYAGTPRDNAGDRERRGRRTPCSGEVHHNAALPSRAIEAIWAMHYDDWTGPEIATYFGTTRTTVNRILRRETRVNG